MTGAYNGRFRIIPAVQLPMPAACSCCGAGDRDCVDWGFTEFQHGSVMLCVVCFDEAMRMLFPAPVEAVQVEYQKKQMALRNAIEEMRDGLDSVFNNFDRSVSDDSGSGLNVFAKSEPVKVESASLGTFGNFLSGK